MSNCYFIKLLKWGLTIIIPFRFNSNILLSYNTFMTEFKRGLNPIATQKIFQELDNPSGENHVIDAADKVYQKIETAEEKAEKAQKEAEEAKKNNIIDSATGCYNRNFWENFVNKEFNPDRGDEASLIVCDINGLKEINDDPKSGGHPAGTALIKNTANFLKENFTRKGDFVVRYGGDEFIVVCNHIGDQEKFIQKVNQEFNQTNQQKKGLNFAFGIAHFDKEMDTDGIALISSEESNDKKNSDDEKTTFKRADKLMYIKKAEQKSKQN